jgi:hypothetical protein
MRSIPYLSNPQFVDDAVQTLRLRLAVLNWLEYDFPLAQIGEDDEGQTYPVIYLQDGTDEYYSLLPDDSVKAYSFFIDDGYEIGFEEELNTYHLSLFVWARLDKITVIPNDFTHLLIGDVVSILGDAECFNISINTKEPFAEFTALHPHDNSLLMRRRTGFRVDFSVYGSSGFCSVNGGGIIPTPPSNAYWGAKRSGYDAGTLWQVSLDDDYLYICVSAGTGISDGSGTSIWKKSPLHITR